jgi:hypothetical protein
MRNKGEIAMAKKQKLGRVEISFGYVVDMNNAEMVEHAKEALYDDLMAAYKNEGLGSWMDYIKVRRSPKSKAGEIPEFLLEDHA